MTQVFQPIATRICIIRHGETDWNVEKRIQGHTDLSVVGREWLDIPAVVPAA